MKFLHITDTHLVNPGATLKGLNPEARFKACIADINRHHADAECAVITGDLADAAEPGAYRSLAEIISACRVPVHLLVGNHDAREPFRNQFPDAPADDSGFVQAAISTSVGTFLLLDTVEAGTAAGAYCHDRRDWLRQQLEAEPDRDKFIFMHHPPFDIDLPSLDRLGLADKAAFEAVIRPHRDRIRHLFYGHAHRPLAGNWLGISCSSLRGTNHQVALDFADPAVRHVDERPEYSVVFVATDRLVIHSHAYPLN